MMKLKIVILFWKELRNEKQTDLLNREYILNVFLSNQVSHLLRSKLA